MELQQILNHARIPFKGSFVDRRSAGFRIWSCPGRAPCMSRMAAVSRNPEPDCVSKGLAPSASRTFTSAPFVASNRIQNIEIGPPSLRFAAPWSPSVIARSLELRTGSTHRPISDH